mmetsp:Transcript_17205/g.39894  ORF Transcript_17205/g.39894 Transcript_17205/m.39894 type:complete len:111 (+) Transcript_17205:415-747(+)
MTMCGKSGRHADPQWTTGVAQRHFQHIFRASGFTRESNNQRQQDLEWTIVATRSSLTASPDNLMVLANYIVNPTFRGSYSAMTVGRGSSEEVICDTLGLKCKTSYWELGR